MNRPDPTTFAQFSYWLAIASSVIVTLVLLLGLVPGRMGDFLSPLQQVMWLALITSGVGLFLAIAARSDFRRGGQVPDAFKRKARIGLRVNLIILVVMLLALVFLILLRVGLISV